MSVKQLGHLALAILLLAQSVSAFAGVMFMPGAPERVQVALSDDTQPPKSAMGDGNNCHGLSREATTTSAEDCCDLMDQPCCLLGCVAPAQAVPVSEIANISASPSFCFTTRTTLYPDAQPSGLFRPPRTI